MHYQHLPSMQVKSGTERYSIAHLSVNDINQFFEAFNPNISVHIFHTVLYAFASLVGAQLLYFRGFKV